MGKKGTRLFLPEHNRNIVELEDLKSRRQLRLKVNELIRLANDSTITTREMQQQLFLGVTSLGTQLAMQLVRSLHREDIQERQSIIWLLTLLNDKETIAPLRHIARDKHIPQSIRLSASLALAGMGVTAEMIDNHQHTRLFVIS